MRHIIAVIIGALSLAAGTVSCSSPSIDADRSLLSAIDSMIPERDSYNDDRRHNIDLALADIRCATTDSDRYAVYRKLYSLYRSYRCDSAMMVAYKRLDIARRLGDRTKVVSASLNLAEGYVTAGSPQDALAILDTIPRGDMMPYHFRYLYTLYDRAYRRIAESRTIPYERIRPQNLAASFRDSAMKCISDSDMHYCVIKARSLFANGNAEDAFATIKSYERRAGDGNAEMLGLAGRICRSLGEYDEAVTYLSKAVMEDLRHGIRTHPNLIELAAMLNDIGDHKRAFTYAKAALDVASEGYARDMAQEIQGAVPIISDAVHEEEARQSSRLRIMLAAIVLLALSLTAALVYVSRLLRRTRAVKDSLHRANVSLEAANSQLKEADATKERYIIDLFDAYSKTVDHQAVTCKNISRLLKTSQFQDALALASASSNASAGLKDLYSIFDTIFLSLYPNFIDDLNKLISPESAFPADSTSLTPVLRVLALMRCGISDSGQIAGVLHYSPQTVYNYKHKARALLGVSSDEFERIVASLGHCCDSKNDTHNPL